EPKYINQQIIWVHQQDTLQNGEIGIFCLNGDAFCKKLQDDSEGLFLISLNKKYPPRAVDETDLLTIFGKVVG
ncbi:MAG: S24 family peptidase, partial [Eubacteriales bacterium]